MNPTALVAVGAAAGVLVGHVGPPSLGAPWLTATAVLVGVGAWLAWPLLRSTGSGQTAVPVHDDLRPPSGIARQLQLARRHERHLSLIVIRLPRTAPAASMVRAGRTVEPIQTLLARLARKTDFVSIGSDGLEIVIVCPETDISRAFELGHRLTDQIARRAGVSAKAGVAGFPDDAYTFADLLEQARANLEGIRAEAEPRPEPVVAGAD